MQMKIKLPGGGGGGWGGHPYEKGEDARRLA